MKAAELYVKCLENEGVEYIIGIPGEENIDVMDALLDSPIKFITTHHEQGAAFMADVYGRLTGRAGVCMSTLGPGATNLITGVADANMDRAPIVAIAGQGATTRLHKESHQILDLVQLFQPITKSSTPIREPQIGPEIVRKAFKVAQTEKPGATFIDFPENIAEMKVEGDPIEDFSLRAAEKWKLGRKGKDDVLLLIVAAQDRKMRIEVGYGLEGDVQDAFASRVIRDILTPAFRAQAYASGIEAAFDQRAVVAAMKKRTAVYVRVGFGER